MFSKIGCQAKIKVPGSWKASMLFKGPVHQLDMYILIKGHCHCDQNAIGLVTFESQGKEISAYFYFFISKTRFPIPNLGAPTQNFCATLFQT